MVKYLRKGTFHLHNDKNGGHPALIYSASKKKDEYKAVQFTHKKGVGRTRLNHNIDPNDKRNTYVLNQPIVDRRKGFGSKELDRYRIHKDDKFIISIIKRKK